MKCSNCGQKIEKTFLNKLVGTYIKKKGKKKPVCNDCQEKFGEEELKEKI